MHKAAQEEGKAIFESMLTANQTDLDNQFEKGEYSFNVRKSNRTNWITRGSPISLASIK